MPESPNILVAVGKSKKGHIPQQTYENIFTKFNVNSFSKLSDGGFYNTIAHGDVSIQGTSNFDIYGFMPGNYKYTYDYSIQKIVDFFQKSDQIEIVICDVVDEHSFFEETFKSYQYIHPLTIANIPFFIKSSIKDKIKFKDETPLLQNQLKTLQQDGHIIFHIAEPLMSATHQESNG